MNFENVSTESPASNYKDFSVEGFNIFALGRDHLPHLICACPNKDFARAIQSLVNSRDQAIVFQTDDQPFELTNIDSHHTLISKFNNIVFPSPGKYWVEILLNGDLILNYPLLLKEIKQ